MDDNSPIKEILYQKLGEITEPKILFQASKGKTLQLMNNIIEGSYQEIIGSPGSVNENLGMFAESLLHYMFTILLIPSQRKVSHNKIDIDIVIPDLKTLRSHTKDALIICFPKTSDKNQISNKIGKLQKIQPFEKNIWLVLQKDFGMRVKTYEIKEKNGSYSKILDDVKSFLSSKKQKSQFKIFKA